MNADDFPLPGVGGRLFMSSKTIYDLLHDSPEFFLLTPDLEAVLRVGLIGLDLNYPLRTRSKVLKSKICEILGYPVPKSFRTSGVLSGWSDAGVIAVGMCYF